MSAGSVNLGHIRANVPASLLAASNWLAWNLEPDEKGKLTKVPYAVRLQRHGSSTDPTTWGTVEQAVKRSTTGKLSGVGYVLAAATPQGYPRVSNKETVIDLDHCRNKETGKIDGWAQNIITQMDSYSEISPSETGVHILLQGRLAGGVRHKIAYATGAIEVYDRARYITITGDHLDGTPCEVCARQSELDAFVAMYLPGDAEPNTPREARPVSLDDEALLAKARNAANGAGFVALYDHGDISAYTDGDGRPDHSRADLALCKMLAWWTGWDAPRMESLFTASALNDRDKWNRADYRKRTIDRAICLTPTCYGSADSTSHEQTEEAPEEDEAEGGADAGANQDETPGANGAHPDSDETGASDDLLGVNLADVEVAELSWLWHARLALGKITMADGEPGLGKSLVTLDLAARVAMGNRMPDGSAGLGAPAGVVIVCGEDGVADTVKPRMLAAGASPDAIRRVRVVNEVPEKLANGGTAKRLLSLVNDLLALEATIKATDTRLLVIDPITSYLGSQTDIYKDSDIRAVLTPLAMMAERASVAILLVRHLNKNAAMTAMNRGLGGIAFIGVARLGLLFADNPHNESERLMGRYKGNIAAPPPTLAYRIKQMGEAENMVKVEWLGERKINISAALMEQGNRHGVVDEAMQFLRDELKDSDVPSTEIFEHGKAEGFSDSALNRAKKRLKIKVKKADGGTHWVWTRIPPDEEGDRDSQ